MQDKFDTRDHQELGDDTEFTIDNGMVVETSKKSGKIRIHTNSRKIESRDDRSDDGSDSLIAPSENERFNNDPYDDANFDCDEESFPATRIRNPNSEKSSVCDDRSGKDPESIIPTSVESPRPKV